MEIEVTNDNENLLLGRREVECLFKGTYGHFSRTDAVQAISKKINVTTKNVYVISIKGESGKRDAKGLFYIYNNEEVANKDISKYIINRNLPKKNKPKEETSSKTSKDKTAEPKKPVDVVPEVKSPEKPKDSTKTSNA